jgi:rhamnosyltransferase subunit B
VPSYTKCRAVVYNGGIGTCARAISAGTPQLVVPASFDQPDNAVGLCTLESS